MSEHELTNSEKVTLVAIHDAHNREDFDQEFLQELASCEIPMPDEMDDRIRRAIQKFIDALTDYTGKGSPPLNKITVIAIKSSLMQSFLVGYEMGRKLRRPLTANETMPK